MNNPRCENCDLVNGVCFVHGVIVDPPSSAEPVIRALIKAINETQPICHRCHQQIPHKLDCLTREQRREEERGAGYDWPKGVRGNHNF